MELLIYVTLGLSLSFGLGLFGGWLASFDKHKKVIQIIDDETRFLLDQIRILQNNQIKLKEIANELDIDICQLCGNKATETLTFGYEQGSNYREDGHVDVCQTCIDDLGREGCIDEIRSDWV